jgi:hypothetical protein
MAARDDLVLTISIGEKKSATVRTKLRWRDGLLCGMEIVRSGRLWDQFIDYLEGQISVPNRIGEPVAAC